MDGIIGTFAIRARSAIRHITKLPMRRSPPQRLIRAVAYQGKHGWIAQCLEYNLAAQADSRDELTRELQRVLELHIEASEAAGVTPFVNLPRAPKLYFDMYQDAVSHHHKQASKFVRETVSAKLELAYAS